MTHTGKLERKKTNVLYNVGQISQKILKFFLPKKHKNKKKMTIFFYERVKDHYTLKIYKYKNKYFFSF